MADTPTPQSAATQSAIKRLENERKNLTSGIVAAQARIAVIDIQLTALQSAAPNTTETPKS